MWGWRITFFDSYTWPAVGESLPGARASNPRERETISMTQKSTSLLSGLSVLFALSVLPAQQGTAQTVEEALSSLAQENAALYLEPLTHGFGHAMTSSFFDGGDVRGLLSFNVGLRVMAALPPEEAKTFTPVPPPDITVAGERVPNPYQPPTGPTPTAAGEGTGIVLLLTEAARSAIQARGEDPDRYEELRFPDGLDIPAIPFTVVEGNVGVGLGTEITLRLIPSVEISDEVGSVGAFGVGVRHSVTNWLMAPTPVDVAVSVGRQGFSAGDYLDASGTSVGLAVSRGFGALILFAEGGLQSSSLDVGYTVENPVLDEDGTRVGFNTELGTAGRFAVGAGLQLAFLTVAGQFSAQDYNTVSLRVGLGTP